jgi:hypothetical protein
MVLDTEDPYLLPAGVPEKVLLNNHFLELFET